MTRMTDSFPLRITYLTAGAAGMYCGSCMHDNTLARALGRLGADVQLVPLYTPIHTDEEDQTVDRVFFGGINVYLQQRMGLFRFLPRCVDRLFDHPALLRWIGSRGLETSAAQLGELTLSMLQGSAGFQRKEVRRLCQWLTRPPQPDLLVLSNVLVAGCVRDIKRVLPAKVCVTLQGDDVFLEELPPRYRVRALEQIRRLADDVDAFLVHSRYYAAFMADYLGIDPARFRQVPLGIDTAGYPTAPHETASPGDPLGRLHVGYLARLAPEKGLHVLVDAFIQLKRMPGMNRAQLLVAGWLGKRHASYAAAQFAKLRDAGLDGAWHYAGTLDRAQKIDLLSQLDVFSVPTVYREPKGLYVLEALAAGVPVVQPRHGAFPELLELTGGGRLVPAEDPAALAQALHELLTDHAARRRLATAGHAAVHTQLSAPAMARQTLHVLRSLVPD
jgi:glycosyltransferase involved in cell wall biosynthesis